MSTVPEPCWNVSLRRHDGDVDSLASTWEAELLVLETNIGRWPRPAKKRGEAEAGGHHRRRLDGEVDRGREDRGRVDRGCEDPDQENRGCKDRRRRTHGAQQERMDTRLARLEQVSC